MRFEKLKIPPVLFIACFLIASCSKTPINNRNFVFIDKQETGEIVKKTFDGNNSYSTHPVFYIGEIKDSIILNDSLRFLQGDNFPHREYNGLYTPSIFIDTTINLYYNNHSKYFFKDSLNNEVEIKRNKQSYVCYPILIANLSPDTMNIGALQYINLIQEVKLNNNIWKAISQNLVSVCGTDLKVAILVPNNMAVCKLFRYTGDTIAEMRLHFVLNNKSVFSNTFVDSISKEALTRKLINR